jgi:hypothetical protein
MKAIAILVLGSALACASTSSSSSPGSSAAAQRSDGQSCPVGQVPAVVEHDTDVYATPDSTSRVLGSLPTRAKVCVDASASGYGFRRVRLSDGRDGFIADSNVSLM